MVLEVDLEHAFWCFLRLSPGIRQFSLSSDWMELGRTLFACVVILVFFFTHAKTSIVSGHEQDFLWPLVVAVAVTILLQIAHQLLIGKPFKAKMIPVSVFYHASLNDWDDDEASAPETPNREHSVDYGVWFPLVAEGVLELGFGERVVDNAG